MSTHETKDESNEPRLPGEAALGRAYRAAAREEPPSALDAGILAQAHAAVATARSPTRRWAVPISIAALVVLSVSVTWQLTQRQVPELEEVPTRTAVQEPAAKPVPPPLETRPATAPVPAAAAPPLAADSAPAPRTEPAAPHAPAPLAERRARSDMAKEAPAASGLVAADASKSAAGAEVIGVRVSGTPGAYEFAVTVSSPDAGCRQFADWWEVVSEDGRLLYRRVLLHSHVDEQPFTRSGGPVPIQPETVVWVRAHMNTTGFGGAAFKGSVRHGFQATTQAPGFAAALASQAPLPEGCAF